MIWIQLPCKDGVLCQHAICGGSWSRVVECSYEKEACLLVRRRGYGRGGRAASVVAGAGEVQRDAWPRRHASQCALFGGMELEDAGRKGRGAVNWGRQDGQTTTLTSHQDV